MRIEHTDDGGVKVWHGFAAEDWRWDDEADDWEPPAPTLELSESEKHELVFELLRGPVGTPGPMGPMGPRGGP